MSYQEFLSRLQKRGSNKHKIGHCYGTRNAWRWVRKNKWNPMKGLRCPESVYSEVINEINQMLAEKLLEGHEIQFPHQMGSICLITTPAEVKVTKDGIKDNYRIDWSKTLKYWYESSSALKNHKKIKRVTSSIYSIRYRKSTAKYKHSKYYKFRPNRSLVKKLGLMADKGRLTAQAV
jgi:hypothetical protein